MESEGVRLRIYDNKRKKLILAPEVFEKYGGVSNETIQIKNGEFAKEIEKEVKEAMQEIIERWQPIFDNIPTEALFAERQRQVKNFIWNIANLVKSLKNFIAKVFIKHKII